MVPQKVLTKQTKRQTCHKNFMLQNEMNNKQLLQQTRYSKKISKTTLDKQSKHSCDGLQ